MWNPFSNTKKHKKAEELKGLLLKEFFNASNQKKAVTRAARESARDQRVMVERYVELTGRPVFQK